jgi:hypothetical protein
MRMCLVVGVAGEDGGVGGAVFQGPRVPVAAAAVHATATVGAGVNSGCAFGGAKSGVRYFLNRQCDISNHVPEVKPKKTQIFLAAGWALTQLNISLCEDKSDMRNPALRPMTGLRPLRLIVRLRLGQCSPFISLYATRVLDT